MSDPYLRYLDAKQVVEDLALTGATNSTIKKALDAKGLAGAIDEVEVEMLADRVQAARSMVPHAPRFGLIRVFGVIVVLIGIGAIWLGGGGGGRYSPGRYGWIAVILGLILIFKPAAGGEEL